MQEELTVRVEHPELPAIRWNEAEVQQNLTEMLAAYTGRVYTPETIKDAKADRAAVNKLDKQLSDAARSAKAFYMKPLEEFLQSAKQMQGQCKAVSGAIDQQVKAVEEAERQDKQDALRAVYADCIGELREMIPFDRLLVPQWLNKTYDLAKASRELRKSVETRREELRLIRETCGEDAEACTTEYLRELNLNAALVEHSRRQNARDAQRRSEAAQKPREWPQSGLRPPLRSLSLRPMKNARSPQKRSKRRRPMQPSRRMAGWISACFRNLQSLPRSQNPTAKSTASG